MTARIGNLFKDLLRPNKQNYSLAPYRIKMLNDQTNNEFTYFEISDIKSDAKKIPKKQVPGTSSPFVPIIPASTAKASAATSD